MSERDLLVIYLWWGDLCFEWSSDPEIPGKVFMSDAHDLVKDKIKGAQNLDSLNLIQ